MPDGNEMETKSPGQLMHDDMRVSVRAALERTLAELELDTDVAMKLRERFTHHAKDRLTTPCQLWGLEVERAEETGEKRGHEKALRQLSAARRARDEAIATTPELAQRWNLAPRAASEMFPREQLVRFVNASADVFLRALTNAQVALFGQVNRGEVPTLDRRARVVHAAVGLGRAAGALLVALWKGAGADALLLRTMREAAHDGIAVELEADLNAIVGKAN